MRLICPHCMSGVTVPDDTAGKEASCPNCGKSFPTPARYSAQVTPDPSAAVAGPIEPVRTSPHSEPPTPPAPPGYVPPAPPPVPATSDGFLPPAPAADAPAPAGYTKSIGITISPAVVAWLPAILLTIVFVLTFFPWVGCYAGGSAVYSQRPWGAAFGAQPNRNYKLEAAGTIPGDWIDKMRVVGSDWKLLIPFFLLLFIAIAFAWTERGFRTLDPRKIPPLAKLWPWHNAIVAGCATLAFFLLLMQVFNGFSMERAIKQHIAEQFAERREKAKESPAAQAKLDYEEEQAFAVYNVERTTWLYLALGCGLLTVLAVLTRAGLEARGNKPPPKFVLHY